MSRILPLNKNEINYHLHIFRDIFIGFYYAKRLNHG